MCLQFTASESMLIQNKVYNLSIKRLPDNVTIKVYVQTSNMKSKVDLFNTGKRIKRIPVTGIKIR